MVEIKKVSEKEIWVDENRFYLDEDGIFHMIFMGSIDEKIAKTAIEEVLKIIYSIEGPVMFLMDINKMKIPSSKARKQFQILIEIETDKIKKVGAFGMHPVSKVIASFVIGATVKEDIRFFKTEGEALAWLKE